MTGDREGRLKLAGFNLASFIHTAEDGDTSDVEWYTKRYKGIVDLNCEFTSGCYNEGNRLDMIVRGRDDTN